jgi:hypothetical protein
MPSGGPGTPSGGPGTSAFAPGSAWFAGAGRPSGGPGTPAGGPGAASLAGAGRFSDGRVCVVGGPGTFAGGSGAASLAGACRSPVGRTTSVGVDTPGNELGVDATSGRAGVTSLFRRATSLVGTGTLVEAGVDDGGSSPISAGAVLATAGTTGRSAGPLPPPARAQAMPAAGSATATKQAAVSTARRRPSPPAAAAAVARANWALASRLSTCCLDSERRRPMTSSCSTTSYIVTPRLEDTPRLPPRSTVSGCSRGQTLGRPCREARRWARWHSVGRSGGEAFRRPWREARRWARWHSVGRSGGEAVGRTCRHARRRAHRDAVRWTRRDAVGRSRRDALGNTGCGTRCQHLARRRVLARRTQLGVRSRFVGTRRRHDAGLGISWVGGRPGEDGRSGAVVAAGNAAVDRILVERTIRCPPDGESQHLHVPVCCALRLRLAFGHLPGERWRPSTGELPVDLGRESRGRLVATDGPRRDDAGGGKGKGPYTRRGDDCRASRAGASEPAGTD